MALILEIFKAVHDSSILAFGTEVGHNRAQIFNATLDSLSHNRPLTQNRDRDYLKAQFCDDIEYDEKHRVCNVFQKAISGNLYSVAIANEYLKYSDMSFLSRGEANKIDYLMGA